jgi:hypothetical protein
MAHSFVGDSDHTKRASDHNPDSRGIVHAFDITHDPKHGVDCEVLAHHLIVAWDGLVSCLRVYSRAELEELVRSLAAGSSYRWDIGRIALGPPGVHASYLVGVPAAR